MRRWCSPAPHSSLELPSMRPAQAMRQCQVCADRHVRVTVCAGSTVFPVGCWPSLFVKYLKHTSFSSFVYHHN